MTEKSIPEKMAPFRAEIDALDTRIVDLLAQRFAIIRRVAAFKHAEHIPAVLPDRVEQVIERNSHAAASQGVDIDDMRAIYRVIVQRSCDLESRLMQTMQNGFSPETPE